MNLYNTYLANKTDSKCGENTIDVFAFSLFLSNFIKGTVEERVNMYSSFLQKNDDDIIFTSDLKQVCFSYFLLQNTVYLRRSF